MTEHPIKLNRKTCYVKNNTRDPDNPKLLETNHEYFCLTPEPLKKYFKKCYYLKKSSSSSSENNDDEPKTAVKMKLIKYRLEVDPKTEEVLIQCYVHFLNTLRNLDTWIDYSSIILDIDSINFISKNQKNKHLLGNKRKAALAAFSQPLKSAKNVIEKESVENSGPLTFLDSLTNPKFEGENSENKDPNSAKIVAENTTHEDDFVDTTWMLKSKIGLGCSTNEKIEQEFQNETNLKKINELYYDGYMLKTHYYSPIPSLSGTDNKCECNTLFVDHNTFHFYESYKNYQFNKCPKFRLPKGYKVVYETGDEKVSEEEEEQGNKNHFSNLKIYEMNSALSKEMHNYCIRLALFCKFFIDHKTLFYDHENEFLFYVMYKDDKFIGYFSKESKNNQDLDHNHLSCFVILPHYQKKGYGLFLASFADQLAIKQNEMRIEALEEELAESQIERSINGAGELTATTGDNNKEQLLTKLKSLKSGPEYPLSPSGRHTYFKYWHYKLCQFLNQLQKEFLSLDNKTRAKALSQTASHKPSHHGQNTLFDKFIKKYEGSISLSEDRIVNYSINLQTLSNLLKIREMDLRLFFENSDHLPVAVENNEDTNQAQFQIMFYFDNKMTKLYGLKAPKMVAEKNRLKNIEI